MKKRGKSSISLISIVIIAIMLVVIFKSIFLDEGSSKLSNNNSGADLNIISSYDNKDIANLIEEYATKNNVSINIEYAGALDIMQRLNSGEKFDAILTSNSMWLYMLDDNISVKNSKSISINPVVFGIKKSKAEELGFIGKNLKLQDILNEIEKKNLKFAMTSATQTNTGASAYLGFLNTLAGSPEILTEEMLNNEELKSKLTTLFSGVERTSGSEEFLEEMYMSGKYDAIVTYETSIININKQISNPDDTIYAIYTIDGVSISDSVFAYIDKKDSKKSELFTSIQSYLLSNESMNALEKEGRRVWYGGVNENANKDVFNPNWGIDTSKYITTVKYPSTAVIKKALGIYQSELRKPTHTIFCLDYSGSMYQNGNRELVNAMEYILTEEKSSKNYLQFSPKDKITVIPFNNIVEDEITTNNGIQTENLLKEINEKEPIGGTNIYDSITKALSILDKEDNNNYNLSIIVMTDGAGNLGNERYMINTYNNMNKDIPVYAILFGSADERQMEKITNLTGGKVFDGRTNLLDAFKSVRGYN